LEKKKRGSEWREPAKTHRKMSDRECHKFHLRKYKKKDHDGKKKKGWSPKRKKTTLLIGPPGITTTKTGGRAWEPPVVSDQKTADKKKPHWKAVSNQETHRNCYPV